MGGAPHGAGYYPNGGGFGGKKVIPTLGVSFGLPYPGPYGHYPISPYGDHVQNAHFGALTPNGLNLGLLNVNPLFSFQVTKSEHGEKLLKPFVNLHLTPNKGIIGAVTGLFASKKGALHYHKHKHLHAYPPPPPHLPFDHHHPHFEHGPPHHGPPFEGPPHHFEGPPHHFEGPPHHGPPHHFEGPPHHFEGPPHHGPPHHFEGGPPFGFRHQKELLYDDVGLNPDVLGFRHNNVSAGYAPDSQYLPPTAPNNQYGTPLAPPINHLPLQNNHLQPPATDYGVPIPNPTYLQPNSNEFLPNNQYLQPDNQYLPPNDRVEFPQNNQIDYNYQSVYPQNFNNFNGIYDDTRYARHFSGSQRKVNNDKLVQSLPAQAPGSAEGSDNVSFPSSRRRRDTDQVVPASLEKKEDLSSVDSEETDSEGRALAGKVSFQRKKKSFVGKKLFSERSFFCTKIVVSPKKASCKKKLVSMAYPKHFSFSVKHSTNHSNAVHVLFAADDHCVHLSHSETSNNSSEPSNLERKGNSVPSKVNSVSRVSLEANKASLGVSKASSEVKLSTADVEPETRKELTEESRTPFMSMAILNLANIHGKRLF